MFFRVDVSPLRVPTHRSPLSQTYARRVWQILAVEGRSGHHPTGNAARSTLGEGTVMTRSPQLCTFNFKRRLYASHA